MAVAGALLVGAIGAAGIGWGLLAGLALSLVWARFSFPLRGRALLWLLAVPAFVALEGAESLGLLAVGLGGWAFFCVVVWGSIYYRLRTGAPWTNGLRFWRLVLTNSDPTSGNALEQVPKLVMTLSAIGLVARDPGASWRVARGRGRRRGAGHRSPTAAGPPATPRGTRREPPRRRRASRSRAAST